MIFFNWPTSSGLVELVQFAVVLAVVLLGAGGTVGERDGWSFSGRVDVLSEQMRRHRIVRGLSGGTALAALAAGIAVPLALNTSADYFTYTRTALIAIVVVSMTILTGWGGQLSLAQFAFTGLGAMTMAAADTHLRLQFFPALVLAVAVSVAIALLVGIPAFRLRGMQLAIVTLVLGVAAYTWAFNQRVFNNGRPSARYEPSSLDLGWIDLRERRTYYVLCLAVLVAMLFLAHRVRRSGFGRALVAIRTDEAITSAYGVAPRRVKLAAFALAGGMAGLAGALLMPALRNAQPDQFPASMSLTVLAMAVIGGLTSVAGAVIGTVWGVGLPLMFQSNPNVALASSGIGLLMLLMYFPNGLAYIGVAIRDLLIRRLVPAEGAVAQAPAPPERVVPAGDRSPAPAVGRALEVADVSVSLGGREIVRGVSMYVGQGETVGLIGANGAGKSTLMNAIGGFVSATGTIRALGREMSSWSPARRARAGVGRTFQNAGLIGDLTVHELVAFAHERALPTHLASVLVASPTWRRRNRQQLADAQEIIAFLGLGRYRDHLVRSLSTGTRRICELACLVALRPRLICLDEPTAGVAQRETEALAPLLGAIRDELGASLLVIEHDMPFIMAISQRVYCLETGQMIASGPPEQIRTDPLVIASYLGTNQATTERSGARHGPHSGDAPA